MNIQFHHRSYSDYSLREMDGQVFALIDISTRPDCKMTHGVKVDIGRPLFLTEMVFTCAQPMYPRDVFLGMANYVLELGRQAVESRVTDQRVISVAVADGQLPEAA